MFKNLIPGILALTLVGCNATTPSTQNSVAQATPTQSVSEDISIITGSYECKNSQEEYVQTLVITEDNKYQTSGGEGEFTLSDNQGLTMVNWTSGPFVGKWDNSFQEITEDATTIKLLVGSGENYKILVCHLTNS